MPIDVMRSQAVARVRRQVRTQDWWSYKIPPLLGWAYASALLAFPEPLQALTAIGAVLASVVFVGAYGYLINDAFDIEADRRSGKANGMAGMAAWARFALCAGAGLGAFVPLLLWKPDPLFLTLLAVNLLLPTLYSVPPFRLKDRGFLGVVADTGAACALPAASMILAASLPQSPALGLTAAVGCAFFAGLRGIVAHQVLDLASDRAAGVSTFVVRIGEQRARSLVWRGIFPLEVACLAALLAVLLPHAPLLGVATALWLAFEFRKRRLGWRLPLFEAPERSREPYIPLVNNEYYEVWLPLALVFQLALTSPLYWLAAAFHLVVFFPGIQARLRALAPVLRTSTTAGPAPRLALSVSRFLPRGLLSRIRKREVLELPGAGPLQVVVGATYWTVSGVNIFAANLVRGLNAAGVPARILLTEEDTHLISFTERHLPFPPDIPFDRLPVKPWEGWGAHWGALVRHLEQLAPCIYIPNSDYRHSPITALLPRDVIVVGIVHSDDPLHYDHVGRLGRYWNRIVAVSRTVRERTVRDSPELADRTSTIPIGAPVPPRRPRRSRKTAEPLQVIYHGILKQHQKRVLDLPAIVSAALDLGVPLELSIVGSGPDEQALRTAAQPLVERGAIRFLGVVGHDDLGPMLERYDVFLLPSEFEGMPNALIESMARGCVPLVSRMDSGIPELVQDGKNGFLAPVGDAPAFAQRLAELWQDRRRLQEMSKAAYRTVAAGQFNVRSMVRSYIDVFRRAAAEAAAGSFVRPPGLLEPPPATVAGVSIFPVPTPHHEPGVGRFPAASDADDYLWRRRRPFSVPAARGATAGLEGVQVIVASPIWARNGVSVLSEDLVRGLRRRSIESRLLLTEENTPLVTLDDLRFPRPSDIPVDELSVAGPDCWGRRWGAMQRYLEERAPCIYIPNYDWRHASVIPRLAGDVSVIGMVHSDDPFYFDQVRRLGRFMSAIVPPNSNSAHRIRLAFPETAGFVKTLPTGADVPDVCPERLSPSRPLRVLVGESLPIDMASVAGLIAHSVRFTCIRQPGAGPETASCARWIDFPSRLEWLDAYASHDVLLASGSGAFSQSLVEAMGRGCVPVVMAGSLPHPLVEGYSGFHVSAPSGTGETERQLAGILTRLAAPDSLYRTVSANAHLCARRATRPASEVLDDFLDLFQWIRAEAPRRVARRPEAIAPPPAEVGGSNIFPVPLPYIVEGVGAFPSENDYLAYLEEIAWKPPVPENAAPEVSAGAVASVSR